MTHVPAPTAPGRFDDRPLDQRGTRHDVCPDCGGQRAELLIAADLFYCEPCRKSGFGPNKTFEPRPEEPQALFSVSDLGVDVDLDRAPIDEGDAWIAEEMPDE